MKPNADIVLKKGKESALLRKHPWIFSGAIQCINNGIEDGDLVNVSAADGKHICWGHYQEKGSISVRRISDEVNKPTLDFWTASIFNAYKLRSELNIFNPSTNAYRLVHGEGDGLPGLIIDIYDRTAVVQCHSSGMAKNIEMILEALIIVLKDGINQVFLKGVEKTGEKTGKYLLGDEDKSGCEILENGIKYWVDWEKGQKTGFFLDQRESRLHLEKFCKNKKVLNAFSYSGGFSLAALKGGAKNVVSVDVSQKACDWASENAILNKLEKNHQSITADVLKYLDQTTEAFDVIILDPPAFAKHQSAKHNAIQAYRRINQQALTILPQGGILFTFSCSQAIDKVTFEGIIRSAAININREIKIIGYLNQPADHPVSIFHPEGDYLKGLVIYAG